MNAKWKRSRRRSVHATSLSLSLAIFLSPGPASAITNGTLDVNDRAVVSLPGCTGTLVAPHVVLTAGHCVADAWPQELQVTVGETRTSPASTVSVVEIRKHPLYSRQTEDYDVALLFITPSISDIDPIPLLSTPLDDTMIGSDLRIVGYGVTAAGGSDTDGAKRYGTTKLVAYLYDSLTDSASPSATCSGDSGGPALLNVGGVEYVAGVTSRGDVDCATFGVKTRVDTLVETFIRPYIQATSPGGTPVGGPCVQDQQCPAGDRCVAAEDDPIVFYCTSACAGNSECPTDMTCTKGLCRYTVPAPSAVGSFCSRDSDCASGLCSRASIRDPQVCTTRCDLVLTSCNAGFECRPDSNGDGTSICVVAAVAPPASRAGCSVATGASGHETACVPLSLLILLVLRGLRKRAH